MPAFHKLPEAFHLLRLRSGKKGKDLAASAGISPAMFSGYLSGERVPSLVTLGKLLDAFGVSLTDLDDLLEQLKAGVEPRLRAASATAVAQGGVVVAGHVVTGAEAENLRQLLQAASRLAELGAGTWKT